MEVWIARQRDNSLYLFTHKPTLFCGRWCRNGVNQHYTILWEDKVEKDLFLEVTFENSPQKIKIEILK